MTVKIIHTTQGVKKITTDEMTAGMTLADALEMVGFDQVAPDTGVKVRRGSDRIELLPDMKVESGDVISLAKSADGGAVKVIHTTQGVKKVTSEELNGGMTLADVLDMVGFDQVAPDTGVKVRRGSDRIELLPDMKVEDGDVISLAKSADGGK